MGKKVKKKKDLHVRDLSAVDLSKPPFSLLAYPTKGKKFCTAVPHRGCTAASVPINDVWQRTASYDQGQHRS
jgi:hypothetical protein